MKCPYFDPESLNALIVSRQLLKKILLISVLLFVAHKGSAQYTVSGNVYNDPDAGLVTSSALPFSMPKDALVAILINSVNNTVAGSSFVNKTTGTFAITGVAAGTYYAMLITPDAPSPLGSPAPPSILETSWTFTGESVISNGIPDVTVDGLTSIFEVAGNFSQVRFGIQERPFAHNKRNVLVNKTASSTVPLLVDGTSAFTQGTSAIFSGEDNSGGTISSYAIHTLPLYGTLYLNGSPISSPLSASTLTASQFAALSYQPSTAAQNQEMDFFTYTVTDNAFTRSNNATYVIPFALLDSDNDLVSNRYDLDDDNDGIIDGQECNLNDPENGYQNLLAVFGSGQFTGIKPSHFGLSIAQRSGLEISADLSSFFGKPAGAIIVTIANANTHPIANEFYVNDITGPSQWTVSGSLGSFAAIEHGLQYFSYDKRTTTVLNGTPMLFVGAQAQSNPGQSNWSAGSDGFSWWLTNNNPLTAPVSQGTLAIGLINPEPKYFQVASTSNNRDEWATYFVSIYPECDYDNDGIPNRLDLDSDNDGCLDALEGASTLSYSNLTNSAATLSVGTGSSALNQNLCGDGSCVDGNGLPQTVSSTNGQSPMQTYNETIISQICQDVLPVTLSIFQVRFTERNISLNWTTTNERNNKVFEVERSDDAKSWRHIGSVAPKLANGNSDVLQDYIFVDSKPLNGQNYYRLKQVDFDDRFAYSSIRVILNQTLSPVSYYPNPTRNILTVNGLNHGEALRLYNAAGVQVLGLTITDNGTQQLNLSRYEAGLYILVIKNAQGGIVSHHKIIKVN